VRLKNLKVNGKHTRKELLIKTTGEKMLTYVKALFIMIYEMVIDCFKWFAKDFTSEPFRPSLAISIIMIPLYFKIYYPLDPNAPLFINMFMIPLLIFMSSVITVLAAWLIWMLIEATWQNVSYRFMKSLEKQRKVNPQAVKPIENNPIYKKQMSIVVKKIKKRVPEKPNQRLDSVE